MASPRFILQLTRALVHDSRARRSMMFWTTLGSLVMLFLGATVLGASLGERPLLFLGWWAACAWLLVASVLLAMFDILMIRVAARRARRDLTKNVLDGKDDEDAR